MKRIGVVLLVLGLLAVIYGGINYSKDRTVFEVGPLAITAGKVQKLPVSAVVGAVVLLGGVGLLIVGIRRSRHA